MPKNRNLLAVKIVLFKARIENIPPVMNEAQKLIITYTNSIIFNVKCKSFFKKFCHDKNTVHNFILFHSEVKW